MPKFITGLPAPIRSSCEWCIKNFRQWRAKSEWRLKVDAPEFLKVDEATIRFRSASEAFAFVSATLKTDRPRACNGNLVLRLSLAEYTPTNIVVPVSASVEPAQVLPRQRVLVSQTPYECYSTGNGHDFEPLANLVSRLSAKIVRTDFCRELPSSLSGYSVIFLGGDSLARSTPAQTLQLRKFVSGGGRLVLAADAFLVPTAQRANELLAPYGLQLIDRDFGQRITNSTVVADSLTSGVKKLDFWRPAPITVSDPAQAKLLVVSEDAKNGFVAVSRSSNRGEVIVLTQSLWWNWIRSDPSKVDNCILLQNLLSN